MDIQQINTRRVFGLVDSDIVRKSFIAEGNELTFKKAREIAQTDEATRMQLKAMTELADPITVNSQQTSKSKGPSRGLGTFRNMKPYHITLESTAEPVVHPPRVFWKTNCWVKIFAATPTKTRLRSLLGVIFKISDEHTIGLLRPMPLPISPRETPYKTILETLKQLSIEIGSIKRENKELRALVERPNPPSAKPERQMPSAEKVTLPELRAMEGLAIKADRQVEKYGLISPDSDSSDESNADSTQRSASKPSKKAGKLKSGKEAKITSTVLYPQHWPHSYLLLSQAKSDVKYEELTIEEFVAGYGSPLCPVTAFRRMIHLVPGRSSQALFLLPGEQSVHLLTKRRFIDEFRRSLVAAGIPNANCYRGHSFRR
ncbi:hypothetical protein QZH41_002482, partial [Actinostola sp. cb2023]